MWPYGVLTRPRSITCEHSVSARMKDERGRMTWFSGLHQAGHPSSFRPHPSEQTLGKPVCDVVGSDMPVVQLAVLRAAFVLVEDLERLILRSDGGVELIRDGARRQLVLGAPADEHRALNAPGDAGE